MRMHWRRDEAAVAPVPAAAPPPGPSRWLLATLAVVAAVQLVVVNDWPAFPSPNERARAYQALAVATRGTLAIDAELARHGGIEDVAVAGGHLYPNKAPGTLPLVVPAALVARLVARGSAERELRLTLVLGRLLVASLPFLLTVLLLSRHLGAERAHAGGLAVAAFALASPAFAASLLLFSHSLTAFLLFAAFVLLHDAPRPTPGAAALAGLALGWAATVEYPAFLPAAVLAALAARRLGVTGAAALAAGGALPALALAAYNTACFGSPLALSSGREAHVAYVTLASRGVFGVGAPSPAALAGLLLSPERGVLVWFPVLVLAAAGLRRRPAAVDDRLPLVLAPAALLLAMSGYPNWHGGWFPGPRYLLPVLPFAVVLAARGVERAAGCRAGRVLAAAAALWGLVTTWPLLASFPFPPEDYPLPALTFALPLLRGGVTVPSWLAPGAVLVVIATLALAGAVVLGATAHARRGEAAGALALVAVAVALAATVQAPAGWKARLEWAVVHDVYAGAAGPPALERLTPEATTEARRAQLAQWIAARERSLASRRDRSPAGRPAGGV